MADIISPVPNNQPVTDRQGMISQVWSGFFNQLWARAGGANSSTNTQLQSQLNQISTSAPNSIAGNNTGSATTTMSLTPSQVTAMLDIFTASLKGLVPQSGGGTTNFLRADGNWMAPPTGNFDFFTSSRVFTDSSSISSSTYVTASNSPAFTFTPNYTAKYKIYASVPVILNDPAAAKGAVQIIKTSGTGVLFSDSQAAIAGDTSTADLQSSLFVQNIYSLTAGVSYVFDIQAKLISGTGLIIEGLDSPFYMFAERVE